MKNYDRPFFCYSKKLKEEFDQTTLHLCNLKMYNKQVEFLKKNS